MVVDRPHITPDDLRDSVWAWLDRTGWTDLLDDPDELDEIVDEHLECIADVCATFAVGTVVDRNGSLISSRTPRVAA